MQSEGFIARDRINIRQKSRNDQRAEHTRRAMRFKKKKQCKRHVVEYIFVFPAITPLKAAGLDVFVFFLHLFQ